METLCGQYWFPVYAVARHAGHDVETAKDLTQGFFANMLGKGWLGQADNDKGRFRTFLATAFKRYMVNQWHRDHAAKRGGFAQMLPLDLEWAERLEATEQGQALSPDGFSIVTGRWRCWIGPCSGWSRNGRPSSRDVRPPATVPVETARFSRAALVGAFWAPLFFIVFVLWFWAERSVPAGQSHGPAWWQHLLTFTLLSLVLAAPFGTTILGSVALTQIRR